MGLNMQVSFKDFPPMITESTFLFGGNFDKEFFFAFATSPPLKSH